MKYFEEKHIDWESCGNHRYVAHVWGVGVTEDGERLLVSRDGIIKSAKVKDSAGYTFLLQKTQIKANGGANGLYKMIERAINEDFALCWVYRILNHVMDGIKGGVVA